MSAPVTGVTSGPIFPRLLRQLQARDRPAIPVTSTGAGAALRSPRPIPEARMPDPQPTPGAGFIPIQIGPDSVAATPQP